MRYCTARPMLSLMPPWTDAVSSCMRDATSPGLFTSNQPTSCRSIALRYATRMRLAWRSDEMMPHTVEMYVQTARPEPMMRKYVQFVSTCADDRQGGHDPGLPVKQSTACGVRRH